MPSLSLITSCACSDVNSNIAKSIARSFTINNDNGSSNWRFAKEREQLSSSFFLFWYSLIRCSHVRPRNLFPAFSRDIVPLVISTGCAGEGGGPKNRGLQKRSGYLAISWPRSPAASALASSGVIPVLLSINLRPLQELETTRDIPNPT